MSFSLCKSSRLIGFIALLGVIQGCGALGEKDLPKNFIEFGAEKTGCLNNFGEKFQLYLDGAVEEKAWADSWDCAIDTMDLFRDFVQPESVDGYSHNDIKLLTSKIFVTNSEISDSLIASVFQLKASLFGGTDKEISDSEIMRIIEFMKRAKVETLKLLPDMIRLNQNPPPEELLAISDRIGSLGLALGQMVGSSSYPMFAQSQIETLMRELNTLEGVDVPEDLVPAIVAIKKVMTAGLAQGIEGGRWERVLHVVMQLGGIVEVLKRVDKDVLTKPNEYGEFLTQLVIRIEDLLQRSIGWHGGNSLPMALIDEIVDAVPDRWIEIKGDPMNLLVVKSAIRKIHKNLMWGQETEWFTSKAVEVTFGLFKEGQRAHTNIERIFERYNLDTKEIDTSVFVEKARSYAQEVTQAEDLSSIERIIRLAETFVPLYRDGETEVRFEFGLKNSKNNLVRTSWLQLAARHLIVSYSSAPLRDKGTLADLERIVEDIADVGGEMKVFNRDPPSPYKKRFTEADLFTWGSNGDNYIDLVEATYLLNMLVSINDMSNRTEKLIAEMCTCRTGIPGDPIDAECIVASGPPIIHNPDNPVDPLNWEWMIMSCFRDEYYPRFNTLWRQMPYLQEEYAAMQANSKKNTQTFLEIASRRCGMKREAADFPISSYDIQNLNGVVHYVEALFSRYDTNGNGVITTRELLRGFHVFKEKIRAEMIKQDPPWPVDVNDDEWVKAMFTYIIHTGKAPTELGDAIDFIAWKVKGPSKWKLKAKRKSIFKVIKLFTVALDDPGCPAL